MDILGYNWLTGGNSRGIKLHNHTTFSGYTMIMIYLYNKLSKQTPTLLSIVVHGNVLWLSVATVRAGSLKVSKSAFRCRFWFGFLVPVPLPRHPGSPAEVWYLDPQN